MDLPVLVTRDEPRLMCAEDLDWLHYLCKKRYSHLYDSDSTVQWYRNIVLQNPMMFFPTRTEDAFTITMLSLVPWLPNKLDANVIFVCADDGCMWQALRLLRASIEWARRRECHIWRMSSDTPADLRSIAKRIGATNEAPRYEVVLRS